jgi:hypothetical protein
VKLGKLVAAVRRELVANPIKSAFLALLLAAAGWFWGPIAWRMLGGAKPPAQAQVAPSQAQTASSTSSPKPVARDNQHVNWRHILAARQQDPYVQPAKFDPQWPQPFKLKVLAATASGEPPPVQVAITPAQAGLVLESIVYGKAKRAAMINGEVYREGSEVVVAAQGAAVTFQVMHIDRASVALERYGRTYRLDFPRPQLPPGAPSSRQRNMPASDIQP